MVFFLSESPFVASEVSLMRIQQNFPVYALSKPAVFGAKVSTVAQPAHLATTAMQANTTVNKLQAPPNAFQVYLTGTGLMFQECKSALCSAAARNTYGRPSSQVAHTGLALQG